MSQSPRKNSSDRGFSLLEVVVALAVMTVGLMAEAALTAQIMSSTRSSKFMSAAGVYASEKLEDLNRWDVNDPQICVPTGSASVGSLTQDITLTVTCPSGSTAVVNYFDNVFQGETGVNSNSECPGATSCFTETVSGSGGGGTIYTTTYHTPSGIISTVNSSTAPSLGTFHRRWVIELAPTLSGSPVNGVRRMTVQVTSLDKTVRPGVNFQMSLIRP